MAGYGVKNKAREDSDRNYPLGRNKPVGRNDSGSGESGSGSGKVPQIRGKLVHFPCGFPAVTLCKPLCKPPVVPCSAL